MRTPREFYNNIVNMFYDFQKEGAIDGEIPRERIVEATEVLIQASLATSLVQITTNKVSKLKTKNELFEEFVNFYYGCAETYFENFYEITKQDINKVKGYENN